MLWNAPGQAGTPPPRSRGCMRTCPDSDMRIPDLDTRIPDLDARIPDLDTRIPMHGLQPTWSRRYAPSHAQHPPGPAGTPPPRADRGCMAARFTRPDPIPIPALDTWIPHPNTWN